MTTHETDRPADYDTADPDIETEAPRAADEPGARSAGAEPELVATDETDEPEADPVQEVAPVATDTAVDHGAGSYQDRWGAIRAGFIDDPGRTVESASALVAEIWDEIERSIADEREGVESRWQSADSSTDDLRAVMQDYGDLYDRFMHFTPELTAKDAVRR